MGNKKIGSDAHPHKGDKGKKNIRKEFPVPL
jgi:hypothetical protein